MVKRKKVTRAYKIGHTDGIKGKNHNNYAQGSVQHIDYAMGYDAGRAGRVADCKTCGFIEVKAEFCSKCGGDYE